MADKSINFRAHDVRGALDGRKTMHRVVMKPQPEPMYVMGYGIGRSGRGEEWTRCATSIPTWAEWETWAAKACSPYAPGDRLYAREAFLHIDDEGDKFDGMGSQTYYRASQNPSDEEWVAARGLKWRPSIHMPRKFSRLTLIVEGVKVERLNDISEEDARAEGVPTNTVEHTFVKCFRDPEERSAERVRRFADLWRSIHGPDAWDANPWVAAITFRVIRENIDRIGGSDV